MITPAQLEILSTPLDQLSFPSFARTQLRKENDWRRRQTEEDQLVFEFKPLITAGDWLSQTDLHHFGRKARAVIENACEALGVTRAQVKEAADKQFTDEVAVKAKFERWCWDNEDVIRKLQASPELVEQIRLAQIQVESP